MQSIIKESKSCFFCGSERDLERHHCLKGTANRKLAEKDGLWVWLCPDCHRGTWGVHGYKGHELDVTLKKAAEYAWLKQNGKTVEDFISRYGKSYL